MAIDPGNQSTASGFADSVSTSHDNDGSWLVVMAAMVSSGAGDQGFAVTYDGVALTRIAHANNQNRHVFIFVLEDPPQGSHTLETALDNGRRHHILGVSVIDCAGHRTAATGSGNSEASSVNSTHEAGDLVMDVTAQNGEATMTPHSGQNSLHLSQIHDLSRWGVSYRTDAPPSGWTWSGSTEWAAAGVALIPDNGGAPDFLRRRIVQVNRDA